MKKFGTVSGLLLMCLRLSAAEGEAADAGKKLEQSACVACHSLRLIESQRLSAAAWNKEVDKMVGWGAVVPERQKLVEYLAQEYSDTKPVPAPARSSAR